MRVTSKSCYAIAALTEMALDEKGGCVTVLALSQRLKISKIYLEHVFSILKRDGLIVSTKGSKGGYTLRGTPDLITVYDILAPIELSIFDSAEKPLENIPVVQRDIMNKLIFEPLNESVVKTLKSVSLSDLADEVRNRQSGNEMYYI